MERDGTSALDLLDPHAAAIAKGLALMAEGHSVRYSAALAGLPHSTLWDRWRAIGRGGREEREAREAAIMEAMEESVAIRREAGRQTLEALQAGEVHIGQVPIIYGIAADKQVKLHQLATPKQPEGISGLLSALGPDGGTLEVTVRPNQKAIDVTPEENE